MDFSSDARWIWSPDEGEGAHGHLWLRLRRPFACPPDLRRATLLVTADSRYELYVNGAWIGHGPVRSFPWAYGYDRYDVTAWLRAGARNVLAARVIHWGDHTFQYILGRGGLLCELHLETADGGGARISSDESWLVSPDPAIARDTPRIAIQQGFEEHYDARRAEDAWPTAGFDAAAAGWAAARVIGPVGVEPWTTLAPRTIPFLTRDEVTPVRVLAAELARPRVGYRWAFDLRERLGKGRHGLRAEPVGAGAQAFVTEIIAPRPCTVTLVVAAEYQALAASCRGRPLGGDRSYGEDPSLRAEMDLVAGRNLFALTGTDTPSLLVATEDDLAFDASRLVPGDGDDGCPWAYLGPLDERDDTVARVLAAATPDELPPAPWRAVPAVDNRLDVHLLVTTSRFLLPEGGFCDVSIDRPQPRERLAGGGEDGPVVADAPALLHRDAAFATLRPHPAGDTHLVVDFGRELVGYVVLELDAAAGTIVDVDLFEGIDDSGIVWTERLRNSLRYTCRAGHQTFRSSVRRGFRYASLTFRRMDTPATLHNLRCLLSTYPVEERGSFACDAAALTRIWAVAAYTVRLCMEDTYTDCPAYEQVAWVGDARNAALVNAVAFGAYDLTDRQLRLTAQSLSPELDRVKPPRLRGRPTLTTDHLVSGWFSEIPMWTFLWIWGVWEHYRLTGDRDSLAALYPAVCECLRRCLGFLSERDLLDVPDVWNLIDWAAMDLTRDGEVTANNALLVEALRRAASMADDLADGAATGAGGLRAEADGYRTMSERIRHAINAHGWSEERGAYVDTVRDDAAYARYAARLAARGERPEGCDVFLARTRVSEPTNTLVLLCDCAPPARAARVMPLVEAARAGAFVGSDPSRAPDWPPARPVPVGSPWFLFFTLETLALRGQVETAVALIRAQWGRMLDKGATTFWETFPGDLAGHWSRSLCHGWSAAPAYILSAYVLGVTPVAPGYARVRVAPHACGLRWARGAVPTPRGPVHVAWARTAEGWDIGVDLPAGVAVEIAVPELTGQPQHVAGTVGEAAPDDAGCWRVAVLGQSAGAHARYRLPLARM